MKLIKLKAGEISEKPIWSFFHGSYLYTHENLFRLILLVITEYRSDRHLIG